MKWNSSLKAIILDYTRVRKYQRTPRKKDSQYTNIHIFWAIILLDWCKSQKTSGLYLRVHYPSVLYIKMCVVLLLILLLIHHWGECFRIVYFKNMWSYSFYKCYWQQQRTLIFLSYYSREIPTSRTVPDSLEKYHCLHLVIKAVISGEKLKQLVVGKTRWYYDPGARHSREKQINVAPNYDLVGLWSQVSIKGLWSLCKFSIILWTVEKWGKKGWAWKLVLN